MTFIPRTRRFFTFTAACVMACLNGGTTLYAQQEPPKEESSSSPTVGQSPGSQKDAFEFRRWGLGGVASYTPFNLMQGGSVTSTTGTLTSQSGARPLGGGVMAYYYVTPHLSLTLDFLYRRTGYQTANVLTDAETTSYYSRTRANYFDFPLLARYESGRYHVLRSPVFIEGGGALRYVGQIQTSTTVDTTVNSVVTSNCCQQVPDRAAHRDVLGVVVGAGLRLPTDEIGVRIVPEVRYTRWTQKTFNSAPTASKSDQAEVLLTFSF